MDRSVLDNWAERTRLSFVASGPEIVHGWGDVETAFEVRSDETGYAVVRRDHGSRSTLATFGTQDEADTFLLLLLGRLWLADRGARPGAGRAPAPGTQIAEVDGNYLVTDRTGRGSVFASRREALWYTKVADLTASEIESFLVASAAPDR